MRNVTLLVCLSPSVAPQLITEASFFGLVNPITQVSNLKMVSTEGQLKAFVQVHNDVAAASVIDALHNSTHALGKLKVYVSHKKFVNYEKRLTEILGLACTSANGSSSFETQKKVAENGDSASTSCNIRLNSTMGAIKPNEHSYIFERDFGLFAASNEFNANQKLTSKNNGKAQILKKLNTEKYQTQSHTVCYNISLTHSNPLRLKSKIISEVFGQFGKIVKKTYDSERLVWTLTFDSEVSVNAATAHMRNCDGDHYTLVETTSGTQQTPDLRRAHTTQIAHDDEKYVNLPSQRNTLNSSVKQSSNALSPECNRRRLHIFDTSQKATAEVVCRLVASVAIPIEVLEACDVHAQQFFYIVKFSNETMASKVHKFMTDCAQLMPHMKATIA